MNKIFQVFEFECSAEKKRRVNNSDENVLRMRELYRQFIMSDRNLFSFYVELTLHSQSVTAPENCFMMVVISSLFFVQWAKTEINSTFMSSNVDMR